MLVSLVHRSSDEAYQRVRSSSPVRRTRSFVDCWTLQPASGTRSIISAEPTSTTRTGDVWGNRRKYRGRYGGTLGSSTVQQIERKNHGVAPFFTQRKGRSQRQARLGATRRGRELRTYIRNTSCFRSDGANLPARNSCWPRPERGVRSWIPRTASLEVQNVRTGRSTTNRAGWNCITTM